MWIVERASQSVPSTLNPLPSTLNPTLAFTDFGHFVTKYVLHILVQFFDIV